MKDNINKPFKNKNFIVALKNALNGIILAFKSESNIRIDIFAMVLTIIGAIIIKVNYIELLIIILTIGIVISAEMFNSAVENTVDLITQEYNNKAKIIKDISAGAVLITSIIAVVVAVIIFMNKLL